MSIATIETAKGTIEYSIVGQGMPLLFIHGGHSNCNETLAHKGFDTSKFMLITPSRPGYGNTPLHNNNTPEKTADLIVVLLDHLNIGKVVVYGISAGGLTAINMASRYPEHIAKLILASAVSKEWLDKEGPVYKMAKRLFNPKTEHLIWSMVRITSGMFPRLIANNFYPQFSKNKPHRLEKTDIAELLETFKHYNSKDGFTSDIDHQMDEKLIPEIECPTLIIHSKNDNSVLFEHAEHAQRMITNVTLLALDNEWGHLFWIGKDSTASIRKTIAFIVQ